MNDNENTAQDAPEKCDRCGGEPKNHTPVEGDCLLPHGYTHNQHPPQASVGWICRGCVDRQRDWLKEIVELYGTLTDVLLAGSIPDDTAEHDHVKKAPASPSPIRLDAFALLRPDGLRHTIRGENQFGGDMTSTYLTELPDVPAVLAGWAQAVYDARDMTAAAPAHVEGAAVVCRMNVEVLARIPDADTFDQEIRWLRRALRAAHGLGLPRDFGRCITVNENQSCHGRVVSEHGETPHCKRCGRRYQDGHDLMRLRVSQQSRLA